MSFIPSPTRPPTPGEYAVIGVCASGFLIVLGLVGLGFRVLSAPEDADVAAALTRLSLSSLAIGVFVGLAFWLVRRLLG